MIYAERIIGDVIQYIQAMFEVEGPYREGGDSKGFNKT